MLSGPGRCPGGLVPYLLAACLLSALLGPQAQASYYPQSGECKGKGKDCTDASDKKSDLRVCDDSTCRYGGVCRDDGAQLKCVCQFQCHKHYVPVCGSNGDTYQNECYRRQASCKQQRLISRVSDGPCSTDPGSGSGDGDDDEGSGSDVGKKFTKCSTCKYGAECDEDSEDVWCICNIDCSGHNENPVCATDGNSYNNPCLVREASCMKQEQIDVRHLGRCPADKDKLGKKDDSSPFKVNVLETTGLDHGDGFYAGMPIPCGDSYATYCAHGKCEIKYNMATCRCDAGYKGARCEEPQDFNILYVVPSGQKLHYVLIAAIIGAVQIAIIVAVVMCITRKCPKNNRGRRQKQNLGHFSSDTNSRMVVGRAPPPQPWPRPLSLAPPFLLSAVFLLVVDRRSRDFSKYLSVGHCGPVSDAPGPRPPKQTPHLQLYPAELIGLSHGPAQVPHGRRPGQAGDRRGGGRGREPHQRPDHPVPAGARGRHHRQRPDLPAAHGGASAGAGEQHQDHPGRRAEAVQGPHGHQRHRGEAAAEDSQGQRQRQGGPQPRGEAERPRQEGGDDPGRAADAQQVQSGHLPGGAGDPFSGRHQGSQRTRSGRGGDRARLLRRPGRPVLRRGVPERGGGRPVTRRSHQEVCRQEHGDPEGRVLQGEHGQDQRQPGHQVPQPGREGDAARTPRQDAPGRRAAEAVGRTPEGEHRQEGSQQRDLPHQAEEGEGRGRGPGGRRGREARRGGRLHRSRHGNQEGGAGGGGGRHPDRRRGSREVDETRRGGGTLERARKRRRSVIG